MAFWQNGGVKDKEFLDLVEIISAECDICKKYKKTPSRPVVCIPLARDFNECVAMDLKEWKKGQIYFLHLIDVATRFSQAAVVYNKDRHTIINKVIQMWIGTGLGSPQKFLSDLGGEFANEHFRDMCENLNIAVINTAGYSPFSNGLCERNHYVLDEMVTKILADQPDTDLEIALAWAVHSKNCLQMNGGYSPYQLVYGRNPKLPSIMTDEPPALEGSTISSVFGTHLNALYAARKAFVQAESSEKIRRALRHQVRSSGMVYSNGDSVYFKRDNCNEWRGPGVVLAQDGKIVLIRHGNTLVRVHVSKVSSINYHLETQVTQNDISDEYVEDNLNSPTVQATDEDVSGTSIIDIDEDKDIRQTVRDKTVLPKLGDRVSYLLVGSTEWRTGTVKSYAGKRSTNKRNWLNFYPDEGEPYCLNWAQHVEDWKIVPDHVLVATVRYDEKKIKEAKQKELDNWKQFEVYEEVHNNGQPCISVRWVCTEKFDENGNSKVKARLVARGFEECNNARADSPTASKEVLRLFLALMASYKWKCNSIDVKAAFLQSEKFQRQVYLKPPREASCSGNVVWKLNKCVYGLNDASREWYFTVKKTLHELGCIQLKTDPAGFYWYYGGELCGLFLMHIDDFLWGGTKIFEQHVINHLKEKFDIGNQSSGTFVYIGLELDQNEQGITLKQDKYLGHINPIELHTGRCKDDFANQHECDELRSLIGQLGWMSNNTRPDISYDVLELSCTMKHPKVDNILKANKCVKKLRNEKCSLFFPCLGDIRNAKLMTYSDASHANLPDNVSSAGGFVVFLVGENGRSCPLSWESRKIKRIVKSTLAAETLAASESADMSFYLGQILSEILYKEGPNDNIPILCNVDNKSLFENVHSTKNVDEKRLRIDLAIMKQMIQRNEICMNWVESAYQISDSLTKRGADVGPIIEAFIYGELKKV